MRSHPTKAHYDNCKRSVQTLRLAITMNDGQNKKYRHSLFEGLNSPEG